MSKHIQAYFQTEDQAESAKTTLLTYKTDHLEVSKLGETIGRNNNLLLPLVAINPSGNMNNSGAVGVMGGGVAGNNIVPMIENDGDYGSNVNKEGTLMDAADVSTNHYENLNYVLVAKVEDEQYDEIVQKLRHVHAYVEKMD